MSNWIKVRSNLRTSPRVVIVASHLSATPITALGAICTAWMLADEHADEHGLLTGIDLNALDGMIGIDGLGEAMAKVGWLEATEAGVQFIDYEKHNGSTAKSRAREQQRKQVSRSCPNKTGQKTDTTRTREEKNKNREDRVIPSQAEAEEYARVDFPKRKHLREAATQSDEVVQVWLDARIASGWVNPKGQTIIDWQADLRTFANAFSNIEKLKKPKEATKEANYKALN